MPRRFDSLSSPRQYLLYLLIDGPRFYSTAYPRCSSCTRFRKKFLFMKNRRSIRRGEISLGFGQSRGTFRAVIFRTFDKRFGARMRVVIGKLLRRRLHKITRGSNERAADTAIQRQLGAADCLDHDPRRITGIPTPV